MANDISGLFETRVIPAGIAAAQSLQYTKSSLRAIYWDYEAEGGEIGQTMNVNIPTVNLGDSSDIGSGPLNPSDTSQQTIPIVLAHHVSASFVIKSWDKIRTVVQLQELYLQPKLEALLRQANAYVTSLFTSSTFNYYGVVGPTTAPNDFTRTNLSTMWSNLTTQGVPVYQPDNLAFITHPACYGTMLADTSFYQAYIVGEGAAIQALQRGALVPTLNAKVLFDQQMPVTTGGKNQGILLHRYAIAGVCAPPPSNEELGQVEETMILPVAEAPNFKVQIQMAFSIKDQGTIINIHTNLGFACIRPDFGSIGVSS
jgi:hypothetical protein